VSIAPDAAPQGARATGGSHIQNLLADFFSMRNNDLYEDLQEDEESPHTATRAFSQP
jgi:hypothetical protein